MKQIMYDDFDKVQIHVGKIIQVEDFPEARKPAYKLTIDFGPDIGIKKSSSQITDRYTNEELLDKLVLGVVNFPPRQVGPMMSEVLTLGFYDDDETVVLAVPDKDTPLGSRLL
jgi:tRNA-binding protein